tara:strand:- start:1 stop:2223 length:2223 start_codon:yes stop_codon:yes gene_type:complete
MARKSKAEINRELFKKANNYYRKKWFSDSQKSMDFYLNDQLSAQEKEDLKEGGMPDFIINRITPAVDIMKFFITANNPKWQAVGADGSDSDIAHIHSMVAEHSWHLSSGKSLFSEVIQDSLVKGLGFFKIEIDPDADNGMGEVIYKSIDPYDVYVDPMSRDFLFRDANFIVVQKNISKTSLIQMFPDMRRKIVRASGNTESKQYSKRDIHESDSIQPGDLENEAYTLEGEQDDILDFYEVYTKEKIPHVNVWLRKPPTERELQKIKEATQKDILNMQEEMEVVLKEKEQELQMLVQKGEMLEERAEIESQKLFEQMQSRIEEQQALMEAELIRSQTRTKQIVMSKTQYENLVKDPSFRQQVVENVPFFKTQIKVCASAGDMYLYERILPIEDYPIVPIPYQHTNTPYAVSAVIPMIGKQREINKSHQIMLHNANLASNLRWLYTEGSIDEEEWEKYSSSPGAMLKYRQGFQPPNAIQPLPINNAFYTTTQQGKQDIEYISGISSSMQGIGRPSTETYRGLLAMDEYGTRRIRQFVNNIVEPALEHLGKIFVQFAQFTYTTQKILRIVQPDAGQTQGEVQEVTINIPIYNDFGKVVDRFNDYASAKFDVRIIAGSTQPLNRWALQEEYFKWFQAGLIDDVAMLEQTDIRNKKQLLQRKSMYAQMQQQLANAESAIKNQKGTIETLERQLVQAGIKDKLNESSKTLDKELNKSVAAQKLIRSRMQDKEKIQQENVDNEKNVQ